MATLRSHLLTEITVSRDAVRAVQAFSVGVPTAPHPARQADAEASQCPGEVRFKYLSSFAYLLSADLGGLTGWCHGFVVTSKCGER